MGKGLWYWRAGWVAGVRWKWAYATGGRGGHRRSLEVGLLHAAKTGRHFLAAYFGLHFVMHRLSPCIPKCMAFSYGHMISLSTIFAPDLVDGFPSAANRPP